MSSPKSSSSSSFSLLSSRFRGLWHVTWTRLTGRRHPGLHLGPWHADPALDWLRLKFESKDMNAAGKHWTGNPLDVKKTIHCGKTGRLERWSRKKMWIIASLTLDMVCADRAQPSDPNASHIPSRPRFLPPTHSILPSKYQKPLC